MAVFKRNCDKCEKDLVSTENAFKECNEQASANTLEATIVVGVVMALSGYLIGRGLK